MKSMAWQSFRALSGSVVTGGPTKAIFRFGCAAYQHAGALIAGPADGAGEKDEELVVLQDVDDLVQETWCGLASSRREPSSIPAG